MTRLKTNTRVCAHCGEQFEATQEYRSFTRKYCSHACNGQASQVKATKSYPPRAEVVRLYWDEGLSDKELGRHFGRSYQWSLRVRKHYGIAGRREVGFHTRNKPLHKRPDE